MEITLFVPNAIIFIYDLTHKNIVIPEYIDDVLTAKNDVCISVGTQADVDGEVDIRLSNHLPDIDENEFQKAFENFIETPGKTLAISTSEDEGILQIDVQRIHTKVSVWADDLEFPSVILVEAR